MTVVQRGFEVGHGHGFVVEGAGERLVITAAHCLPFLPPAPPSFGPEARTYGPLLAPRGEAPRAWAVCRFVDPIADIAVLGSPNAPHADDYKALTATALPIADRVRRHPVNFWASAWLLSLDGRWFSGTIRHFGGPLWITHPAERVLGGMSGSPIVAETGTAIEVVCTTTSPREGGPPRSDPLRRQLGSGCKAELDQPTTLRRVRLARISVGRAGRRGVP